MAEFVLNIGDPNSKKTLKREVKEKEADMFIGKKIGDVVKGEVLELPGYEMEITGGSDYAGFPMRKDVQGTARKKVLIVSGVGIRKNRKGRKARITVAGNTVFDKTAQINLKVLKAGKTPLFEEEKPAEEEAKPEETKEPEAKSEEVKEAPKKEAKAEEKPKKEE
ncbi:MAG: 30S ribosomal protein S6e [Candidatus Woesearchaeota archaeon]